MPRADRSGIALRALLGHLGWRAERVQDVSCVEIRDHFACNSGWLFGEVWEDLERNFFPDMKAGGPCMAGLSPAAKARLFERKLKYDEEQR